MRYFSLIVTLVSTKGFLIKKKSKLYLMHFIELRPVLIKYVQLSVYALDSVSSSCALKPQLHTL